jgi:hypothetical protein
MVISSNLNSESDPTFEAVEHAKHKYSLEKKMETLFSSRKTNDKLFKINDLILKAGSKGISYVQLVKTYNDRYANK